MNNRKQYERNTAILVVVIGFGVPCLFTIFLGFLIRLLSLHPIPALS